MIANKPIYETGVPVPDERALTEYVYVQVNDINIDGDYEKQCLEVEQDGTVRLGLGPYIGEDDREIVKLTEEAYQEIRESAAISTGQKFNSCSVWRADWGSPSRKCVVYLGERGYLNQEGIGDTGEVDLYQPSDIYIARSITPADIDREDADTESVKEGMDEVLAILQGNDIGIMNRPRT